MKIIEEEEHWEDSRACFEKNEVEQSVLQLSNVMRFVCSYLKLSQIVFPTLSHIIGLFSLTVRD